MRNYKILESLCDKIESWGIDPITLAKAISIFLTTTILIVLMVTFPIVLVVVLTIAVCVVGIGLLYLMLL